jgi:hypothetical protein
VSRVLGWLCDGDGRWAMGDGRWAMGDGDGRCGDGLHRRRMPPRWGGRLDLARGEMRDDRMGDGRWAVGDGRWAVGDGRWRWAMRDAASWAAIADCWAAMRGGTIRSTALGAAAGVTRRWE